MPDPRLFPDFDDNLRQAFRRETELFFESIIDEDRSVLDLLRANYTFLNERLAKHYGIPNVYGSHFRRVTLAGQRARRAARPGQHPDRHVVRATGRRRCAAASGCSRTSSARPPPPPPPNVPPLKENSTGREGADDARADGAAPQPIRCARAATR